MSLSHVSSYLSPTAFLKSIGAKLGYPSTEKDGFLSQTATKTVQLAIDIFLVGREMFFVARSTVLASANTSVYVLSFSYASLDSLVGKEASWAAIADHAQRSFSYMKASIGYQKRDRNAHRLLVKLHDLTGVKVQGDILIKERVLATLGKVSHETGRFASQHPLLIGSVAFAFVSALAIGGYYLTAGQTETVNRVPKRNEKDKHVENGQEIETIRESGICDDGYQSFLRIEKCGVPLNPTSPLKFNRLENSPFSIYKVDPSAIASHLSSSLLTWVTSSSGMMFGGTVMALAGVLTFWKSCCHRRQRMKNKESNPKPLSSQGNAKDQPIVAGPRVQGGHGVKSEDTPQKASLDWKTIKWTDSAYVKANLDRIFEEVNAQRGLSIKYLTDVAKVPQDIQVYRQLIGIVKEKIENEGDHQRKEFAVVFTSMLAEAWYHEMNQEIEEWKDIQWTSDEWLKLHFGSLLSILKDRDAYTKETFPQLLPIVNSEESRRFMQIGMNYMNDHQELYNTLLFLKNRTTCISTVENLKTLMDHATAPFRTHLDQTLAFADALGKSWPNHSFLEENIKDIEALIQIKHDHSDEKVGNIILLAILRSAEYHFKNAETALACIQTIEKRVINFFHVFGLVERYNKHASFHDAFIIPILTKMYKYALTLNDIDHREMKEKIILIVEFWLENRRGDVNQNSYVKFLADLACEAKMAPLSVVAGIFGNNLKSKLKISDKRVLLIDELRRQIGDEKLKEGSDNLKIEVLKESFVAVLNVKPDFPHWWSMAQYLESAGYVEEQDPELCKKMLQVVVKVFSQRIKTIKFNQGEVFSSDYQSIEIYLQLVQKKNSLRSQIAFLTKIDESSKIERLLPCESVDQQISDLETQIWEVHYDVSHLKDEGGISTFFLTTRIRLKNQYSSPLEIDPSSDIQTLMNKGNAIREKLMDSRGMLEPSARKKNLEELLKVLYQLSCLPILKIGKEELSSLLKFIETLTAEPLFNYQPFFKDFDLLKSLPTYLKLMDIPEEDKQEFLMSKIDVNWPCSIEWVGLYICQHKCGIAKGVLERILDQAKKASTEELKKCAEELTNSQFMRLVITLGGKQSELLKMIEAFFFDHKCFNEAKVLALDCFNMSQGSEHDALSKEIAQKLLDENQYDAVIEIMGRYSAVADFDIKTLLESLEEKISTLTKEKQDEIIEELKGKSRLNLCYNEFIQKMESRKVS